MQRVVCAALIGGLSLVSAAARADTAVDWTGFHLSGLAGIGWGKSDTTTTGRTGSPYFSHATDYTQVEAAGNGTLSDNNWTGSLQVGYDRQFGNWLLGLSITADALNHEDSRSAGAVWQSAPGSFAFSLRQTVEADWSAALLPRLGWAQDNWMIYGMVGIAVTRASLKNSFSDNYTGIGPGASGFGEKSETKIGAAFGVGGEYALDARWSVSAQYRYMDFGQIESAARVSNGTSPVGQGVIDNTADLRVHSLMIGLTHRF